MPVQGKPPPPKKPPPKKPPGGGGDGNGNGNGNGQGNGNGNNSGKGGGYSRTDFARALLGKLGAAATKTNINFLVAWMAHEGTVAGFNPLATTLKWAGSYGLPGNPAGVQQYRSFADGVAATAATLRGRSYSGIVSAFRTGHITNSSPGVANGLYTWSGHGYSSISGFGADGNVTVGGGSGPGSGKYSGQGKGDRTGGQYGYGSVLQGYGISPGQFGGLIDQATRSGWSDAEFLGHLYASKAFHTMFPGIFRADGSLKMSPLQYRQTADQYMKVARNYGIAMNRGKLGLLFAGDVDPTDEWQRRAEIYKATKAVQGGAINPNTGNTLREDFDTLRKADGHPPAGPEDWFRLVARTGFGRLEDLYEASVLRNAGVLGAGGNAGAELGAARQIGRPGEVVDLKKLVDQIRQVRGFVAPELQAAGVSPEDLAVLESGSDPKNQANALRQILGNRQALQGINPRTDQNSLVPARVGA